MFRFECYFSLFKIKVWTRFNYFKLLSAFGLISEQKVADEELKYNREIKRKYFDGYFKGRDQFNVSLLLKLFTI